MGNSLGGGYNTTREDMMRAYDKLPHCIRQAMQDAIENWVPQPLLTEFNRFGGPGYAQKLVKRVQSWNAQELSARAMARRWGPGHPQAIGLTQKQIRRRKLRHKTK